MKVDPEVSRRPLVVSGRKRALLFLFFFFGKRGGGWDPTYLLYSPKQKKNNTQVRANGKGILRMLRVGKGGSAKKPGEGGGIR